MSDHFLSRWSRRKQGLDTNETPKTEPAKPPQTAPSAVLPQLRANEQPQPQPSTAARSALVATNAPAEGPQAPVPTMQDVQGLTPSSDFQTFMRQGVPGEVRNAAMKKLFTDPHFNVMDGLDIYIGDYNTPDPLPAGMLEKMVGAELLNLFPKKAQIDTPHADATDVQENPDQSPDAPEGSPLVAQSPPSPMTQAPQPTPALQASEPIEHDHPDLQLQPNHAPASPSPGQSTG
ncbi:DUF3306 domain-containing protein [Limnohabitans sp. Rim47]|uniref:DUF3306 domain-containing protein n=1 Tax=Limnohabitans sp. Rim47 TaxID=1100721 RepID=UPI000474CC25|nr:DUF3306 domain-containing protein [Limnohabitans sp. Rim47]